MFIRKKRIILPLSFWKSSPWFYWPYRLSSCGEVTHYGTTTETDVLIKFYVQGSVSFNPPSQHLTMRALGPWTCIQSNMYALCAVLCALCSVQCFLCAVLCALYILYALCDVLCTLHAVLCVHWKAYLSDKREQLQRLSLDLGVLSSQAKA